MRNTELSRTSSTRDGLNSFSVSFYGSDTVEPAPDGLAAKFIRRLATAFPASNSFRGDRSLSIVLSRKAVNPYFCGEPHFRDDKKSILSISSMAKTVTTIGDLDSVSANS